MVNGIYSLYCKQSVKPIIQLIKHGGREWDQGVWSI